MKISALIAENVRNFEGEHIIDLDPGLNVFIGKNNTGKSTLLRIPGLVERQFKNADTRFAKEEMFRAENATGAFGVRCAQDLAPQFFHKWKNGSLRVVGAEQRAVLLSLADKTPWLAATFDALVRQDAPGGGCALRLPGAVPVDTISWFRDYRPQLTKSGAVHYEGVPNGILLVKELQSVFSDSPFGTWAHRQIGIREEYGQHKKRLLDANDDDVQATLTFLKLKHEAHFRVLADALVNALPEFGRLDFEEFGAEYKPAFKLNHTDQLLTRELVGSGSWTFLSILTAAHAAVATGAETIVLDEPHLYLHPGLERRLVKELTREETWEENKAPQLLVATHSPVFLDAAWRKGKVYLLDWEDEKRTKVKAHELTKGEIQSKLRSAISASSISDLLYADRIVFVEGASDVKTLEVLTDSITSDGASIRFEPLNSPDNIRQQPFVNALRAVSRGFSSVPGLKPVLLLDADKRTEIEAIWKTMESSPTTGFEVHWAGVNGHDMESIFADVAFLKAYFGASGVVDDAAIEAVVGDIVKPAKQPKSNPEKASQRLRALQEKLLPSELPSGKSALLEALATFHQSNGWKTPLEPVQRLIARLKGEKP